ncbi:hypothetical protein N9035_00965 [Akkermansiaceae bacterium]|nr:hypothetical protein [Akkermansiaceae bacterium]MDB4570516.1 hypothetical protein [Akkermansiaceae bacterium]
MATPGLFAPQQPNTQVPSHHQAPAPQLQQVPQSLPEETYQVPLNRPPLPDKITAKLPLLGTSLPVGLSVTHPTSNQPEAQQIPDRST